MTAPKTDNRPTDTIRDAFEAMIAFLTILIGGPMPRAWPEIAAVAARAIDSWARTAEGADRAVAAIAALRDLIQRAAEEHNRRTAPTGLTPERIREARERCAEATPGPWVHSPPGVDEPHVSTKIGSDSDRVDWIASPRSAPSKRWHDAAFIAHAREDLPAALAEIERRATHAATWKALARRLMRRYRSERRGHDLTRSDRKKHRAEIERLTAELAARAPADHLECPYCHAEIESTAGDAERVRCPECGQFSGVLVESGKRYLAGFDDAADRAPAPADASLEARADDKVTGLYRKFIVERADGSSKPGGKHEHCEYLVLDWQHDRFAPAGGRGYADACEDEYPALAADVRALAEKHGGAVVRAVDASRPAAPEVDDDEPLPRGARVRTVAHLTALFSPSLHPHRRADATGKIVRRMTSGDIYYDVRHDDGTVAGYERSELIDLSADASRPGLTEEQAELHRAASAVIDAVIDEPLYELPIFQALAAAILRASRGETGPAAVDPPTPDRPAGLTRAMHDAAQRRSEPPRIEYEHGPDGETYRVEDDWQPCACGAAVSRGEAHPTGPGHDVDWSAVDRQRATLPAGDPAAPDPRVDYSGSMRPAVTGGECAECLHASPLHERTCPTLARRPQ